jgi:hypothetical protein
MLLDGGTLMMYARYIRLRFFYRPCEPQPYTLKFLT